MIERLLAIDWTPFWLSFKLAGLTVAVLFVVSLPLAWFLARTHSRIKPFLEALTAMPIVLPPSVLGFYILVLLAPDSVLGIWVEKWLGIKPLFSFPGLVIASCLYSFPFMVQPLQSGFESLNRHMLEAGYVAGKSEATVLFRIALPNIKPALLTAIIVTFAHTVGEFGVVLMVGGSIPGETKVASVAIYELVEEMDYATAHIYAAAMMGISFLVLLGVYLFNRRHRKKIGAFGS